MAELSQASEVLKSNPNSQECPFLPICLPSSWASDKSFLCAYEFENKLRLSIVNQSYHYHGFQAQILCKVMNFPSCHQVSPGYRRYQPLALRRTNLQAESWHHTPGIRLSTHQKWHRSAHHWYWYPIFWSCETCASFCRFHPWGRESKISWMGKNSCKGYNWLWFIEHIFLELRYLF